jgi:dipeptidyl aminopeptidase/acylaminoacyl peptidase
VRGGSTSSLARVVAGRVSCIVFVAAILMLLAAPAPFARASDLIFFRPPNLPGSAMWTSSKDGSSQKQLTTSAPWRGALSPDGRFAAYPCTTHRYAVGIGGIATTTGICLTSTSVPVEKVIFDPSQYDQVESVGFSPGGGRLVFSMSAAYHYGEEDLYVINTDGTGLRRLTNTSSIGELYPSWSPDGTQIAFFTWSTAPNPGGYPYDELWLISANGGTATKVPISGEIRLYDYQAPVSWSPDGSQVAFSADVGPSRRDAVWKMNVDGTNLQVVTENDICGVVNGASWSPDGGRIAYETCNTTTGDDIWSVKPDGSDNKLLISAASRVSYQQPRTPDSLGPTLTLSGPLYDASDFAALQAGAEYDLQIDATDAVSGVKSIELQVDGLRKDYVSQSCETGACPLSRHFILKPEDYVNGSHTVKVITLDQRGNSKDESWDVDVEPAPTSDPFSAIGDATTSATASLALDLLPCTSKTEPTNFATFSTGASFEGLANTHTNRDCDLPFPGETARLNVVDHVYGDCDLDSDVDSPSCLYPLVVQSSPACEANRSTLDQGSPDDRVPVEDTELRGVPAAILDAGRQVELYTGATTIDVYGQDASQVSRAVDAIQPEPVDLPPQVTSAPEPEGPLPDLPPPVAGAMDGVLGCS